MDCRPKVLVVADTFQIVQPLAVFIAQDRVKLRGPTVSARQSIPEVSLPGSEPFPEGTSAQ